MCHGQKSRFIGDGHPTFNDGILLMGPYKPLRTWVDEFIPYYMEMSWELIDPGTHGNGKSPFSMGNTSSKGALSSQLC